MLGTQLMKSLNKSDKKLKWFSPENNSFSFHGTIDTRLLCHFIVSCRFCEIILSSQETEYSDFINEESKFI